MQLTEEELKQYTCGLRRKFLSDYNEQCSENWFNQTYDSNKLLEYLIDYPEINDKSKEHFYFMCMKYFKDVPKKLQKRYMLKFSVINCGNEIHNSYGCFSSNLLIDCNAIKHSFGCNKCKFSSYLLYCTGQRHETFMAFNQKVSRQRFTELIKLSPEELKNVPEFKADIYEKINSLIEDIFKVKNNAT